MTLYTSIDELSILMYNLDSDNYISYITGWTLIKCPIGFRWIIIYSDENFLPFQMSSLFFVSHKNLDMTIYTFRNESHESFPSFRPNILGIGYALHNQKIFSTMTYKIEKDRCHIMCQ